MRSEYEWDKSVPIGEQAREESRMLPPRRVIHPSEKPVWTKRFYQLLVILFAILVVTLFIWGEHYTS